MVNNITNNFTIFVEKLFNNNSEIFNIDLLDIVNERNVNFNVNLKYSTDKCTIIDEQPVNVEYCIVIVGEIINVESGLIPNRLDITQNINNQINEFTFSCINYDGVELDYLLKIHETVYNKTPKWNFYDNQQVTLNNWKDQIVAVNQMYGHKMTYFKTSTVESSATFQNNFIKDVVSIKKLLISVPPDLIPKDINVYSDWDFPMQDEYYFDVVDSVFKQAFGENEIPSKDDVIYFPMINKFVSVVTMQPKNGFMSAIGWWRVYIANYEENESVIFSTEIQEAMGGTEFADEFNKLNEFVESAEVIQQRTHAEKEIVTENYSNEVIDSVNYIDLKETEAIRQQYHRRLNIVSINPDNNAFPVTMYDLNNIDTRVIAMVYDLSGNITVSKNSLNVSNIVNIVLNFSFNKFGGEIFDLLNGEMILFTSLINRKGELMYNFAGEIEKVVITKLDEGEFYQLAYNFDFADKIFTVNVFKLANSIKNLIFTKDFILKDSNNFKILDKVNIYGGKYYYNDFTVNIDGNKIFQDYCNPLLLR